MLWFNTTDESFWTVPRSGGTPQEVQAPLPDNRWVDFLATSGDWFLTGRLIGQTYVNPSDPTTLMATPVGGGTTVPILKWPHWVGVLGDGTAMAVAGSGATHSVYHITPGPTEPIVTSVHPIEAVPASTYGLALSGSPTRHVRRLGLFPPAFADRSLGVAGDLVVGPRRTVGTPAVASFCNGPCGRVLAAGGWTAYVATVNGPPTEIVVADARGPVRRIPVTLGTPYLVDLTPSMLLYTDNGGAKILDIGTGVVAPVPPGPAFDLWGGLVWRPRHDVATSGVFHGMTVAGVLVTSVTTSVRCAVQSLQVVGRWLLYRCDGGANGVVDLRTDRIVAVPGEEAIELGDGFVVWAEYVWGANPSLNLNIIDLSAATPTSTLLTQIPPSSAGLTYGVRWAIDAYGGQTVAYVGADGHSCRSRYRCRLGAGTAARQRPTDVRRQRWTPEWTLNKPANWQLTISMLAAQLYSAAGVTGPPRSSRRRWAGVAGTSTWTLSSPRPTASARRSG